MVVRLGTGGRRVRVPLGTGSFTTVEIAEVTPLDLGAHGSDRTDRACWPSTASATGRSADDAAGHGDGGDRPGPFVIDVDRTLARSRAADRLFDVPLDPTWRTHRWPLSS